MENVTRSVGVWGVGLALAAGLWAGCAPRTEIAEPGGQAGASEVDDGNGTAGTGGSAGTAGTAGSAGSSDNPEGGVGSSAGSAGMGGANDALPADCFDVMTADDSALLVLGPNNEVFPSVRKSTQPLVNYASQVVFDPSNWELNANFPPSNDSDDATLQLPEELNEVADNVGEVRITRPECRGLSAAGRTVRVYAWWKLGGAIVRTPTEGIVLGTTGGEWFEDSGKSVIVGGSEQTRPLNSLSPLVLEHTFPASDETDAGDLVLKLWLLEAFEFPSTLYINRIEWE